MPSFDPSQFINRNPVEIVEEVFTPTHTFSDFKLDRKLTQNIAAAGIATPSPIQDQVIPEVLAGKDVIGLAQTGTGKTAAFLVPLIEMTLANYSRQTLIMAPTRELAIQVESELQKLAKGHKLYSTVCVGGANIRPQISGLKRKNHFIIGTPGRLIDLMERGVFDTSRVTTVVLDEADRMLDMGFIHDMRRILADIPRSRETLFFSATMNEEAKRMVHDFMRDPVTISVKKKVVTDSIAQDVLRYPADKKFETLAKLLQDTSTYSRVIVFMGRKHHAEKLATELRRAGIGAEAIHGNKSHSQRQRALGAFKRGSARVLVATDVAARGIHVDRVSHVINYDLPNTFDDYVHRIGRTGRGIEKGQALTFVPA